MCQQQPAGRTGPRDHTLNHASFPRAPVAKWKGSCTLSVSAGRQASLLTAHRSIAARRPVDSIPSPSVFCCLRRLLMFFNNTTPGPCMRLPPFDFRSRARRHKANRNQNKAPSTLLIIGFVLAFAFCYLTTLPPQIAGSIWYTYTHARLHTLYMHINTPLTSTPTRPSPENAAAPAAGRPAVGDRRRGDSVVGAAGASPGRCRLRSTYGRESVCVCV